MSEPGAPAPPPLILASTSPYRAMLLDRLGVPYTQQSPGVDEEAVTAKMTDPAALAERLAVMKAEAVAHRSPDAVCLGSDQVAVVGGEIVSKPGTPERALAQLIAARDGGLSLYCGVALAGPGERRRATVVRSDLVLHPLSDERLRAYVAKVHPVDCAGSFKLEEPGGLALFDRIEAADWTAVIGLPLLTVAAWLRDAGHTLP
ncbi:Maf family protein [Alienimonas chondri]|uniref:7-methyl-GTP pyrophosphatase n=1 Tax=Alienimonas chondri TaxID=2681879 RepID=A0ABX1VCU7_9PLAN|nr:nucleoside triphosphate pyrophosphatase [Alienimonas chondri]NNJ25755.1 Maf-like protein YceF [Alienimonas chondri]